MPSSSKPPPDFTVVQSVSEPSPEPEAGALAVTGGFLSILVFTSLPRVPLLALAGSCLGLSRMMTRRESQAAVSAVEEAEKEKKSKQPEERVEDFLTVDPMEIELGVGLIRLADPNRGGDLLDRVQRVRQNIAGEIGILMPKVRIRDNMRLEATAYRIKIADIPVAQAEIQPTQLLAIDSGMTMLTPPVSAMMRSRSWIGASLKSSSTVAPW